MPMKSVIITAALTLLVSAAAAQAQATKVVKKFNDWVLYSHSGAPATICFISAQPRETKPAGAKKNRSYFYVSAWPSDGVKAEISVNMGDPLSQGTDVTVRIGSASYKLFSKGQKAYVSDPTDELKLINSMKAGSFMTVSAQMSDGTSISDTYSLIGVTAAVNSLSGGCS